MEAFAGLGEEERVRIFESQAARDVGFGDDISVAQLGQDDFQRFAKAVEHANRALERDDLRRGRRAVRGFIENEREFGLRVFGMDEEGGAAVDAGAQHAQAFVGGVP